MAGHAARCPLACLLLSRRSPTARHSRQTPVSAFSRPAASASPSPASPAWLSVRWTRQRRTCSINSLGKPFAHAGMAGLQLHMAAAGLACPKQEMASVGRSDKRTSGSADASTPDSPASVIESS